MKEKRKARPARLDADRTAKPLTTIVAHKRIEPSGNVHVPGDVESYSIRDTNPHHESVTHEETETHTVSEPATGDQYTYTVYKVR